MNYSGKLSKEINLSPSSILYYNQETNQYQSAFSFIENIFTELEEVIYPYGSYYITSQNINPSKRLDDFSISSWNDKSSAGVWEMLWT